MSSQCYIMNMNAAVNQTACESKPPWAKEKVMSYEEKSVGSTAFFKCEACPYMALAEDDIKFHLFTVHPDLARSNGLADNVQIPCPGCTNIFDAEETLRTHLRNHHKMGIKDIRKMVKSLVQIALKNAKLKKEDKSNDPPPPNPVTQNPDVKIPQVIEIVPDVVNANSSLPKGVAFISVDELHKMSAPNFEKIDPKEIIQEASINIVYTNEMSAHYVNVSEAGTSSSCNMIQVSSVPPDLISSIQPRMMAMDNANKLTSPQKETHMQHLDVQHNTPHIRKPEEVNEQVKSVGTEKLGTLCSVNNCHICLKEEKNITYHRKCHQNGKLVCPECSKLFPAVESLHTHLWKVHAVDMELPTCDVCGFKTYKRHRLINIHMKCHGKMKTHSCVICSKMFNNANQLSKHKLIHKKDSTPAQCSICQREFSNERRLKLHVAAVHDKLKPFKCSHCDYTGARKEELKLHLRSHTGDKPYACDQCNYRSSDHNAMRRHKKIHSQEGVYKCKYCPYTTIQSTVFASHMISKHPNVTSNDVHRCPYCPFKSVNKEKYVTHLTTHTDKEGIQLLIEMTKNKNKPSWNIPSENEVAPSEVSVTIEEKSEAPKSVNDIPIEVYDCESISESLPQDYSKTYCTTSNNDTQQGDFQTQGMVTDLSKEDNSSVCLISESSNDTLMKRHQFSSQHPLQMTYDSNQSNLHGFLNTAVSMDQSLLQNNNVNSLASNHCAMASSISNNIMNNFPIRLPPVPQVSLLNNITLKPVDKISLPMTKVTGPIIKPTQILPVPSSSNSPVNTSIEDGVPRKKPKISVKSNLILKGPDQVNMFHSQQKMAFRRLEDNERFGLAGAVTFNNLITTQFMQLPPEPTLSESPSNIMDYPQENMLGETATTPVDNEMNESPQIFSFNQQINVNSMNILPPPQKIQTNDPSYIKLESTIKQNTQSPSLERMCNANLLNNSAITREYKASPPLEDLNKNMSEIKNEVKSDFYNIPMTNTTTNPSIIDQFLMENIIGEQYSAHMDLSAVVLQEISDQQNDVIEIDDNSDDTKLLPPFDMNNFPIETFYLMHNDFHFNENEISTNNLANEVGVNEINRMVTEVPIINQKDMDMNVENASNDFPNFIQGKKDPMMNTSVRPTANKINVKNIELMKN